MVISCAVARICLCVLVLSFDASALSIVLFSTRNIFFYLVKFMSRTAAAVLFLINL